MSERRKVLVCVLVWSGLVSVSLWSLRAVPLLCSLALALAHLDLFRQLVVERLQPRFRKSSCKTNRPQPRRSARNSRAVEEEKEKKEDDHDHKEGDEEYNEDGDEGEDEGEDEEDDGDGEGDEDDDDEAGASLAHLLPNGK